MYKRTAQGWMKHLDFILMDVLALQIAYCIAHAIKHDSLWPYGAWLYRNIGIVLSLCDVMVCVLFNTMHNVIKRDEWTEAKQTVKQALTVFAGGTVFLFSFQYGNATSRAVLFLTFGFHMVIGFLLRELWKRFLRRHGTIFSKKETMLAVLNSATADMMMERLTSSPLEGYKIVGVVLDDPSVSQVRGVPVVCPLKEAAQYVCREWIDSVYIDCPSTAQGIPELMDACRQMAVPVHYHILGISQENMKQFAEKIGGSTVLTTTINYATPMALFAKRAMDIVGGLFGSLAALIIIAAVGPKIKKASPGPILYRSERIGQNGKHFRMIKIRSMHLDADARKQELMEQNRVKDGMMFKVEFDPRIIGNEVLPDGTKKTGIGDFIRRTSLDEFPQFFNVLKGEMSLVGTRPPTVDEWEKYKYHHRARLACKPGVTGMWQVSGRSEITDFEEVVKLDTDYINRWSLGLDIKILLKTVKAVLKHDGAM